MNLPSVCFSLDSEEKNQSYEFHFKDWSGDFVELSIVTRDHLAGGDDPVVQDFQIPGEVLPFIADFFVTVAAGWREDHVHDNH